LHQPVNIELGRYDAIMKWPQRVKKLASRVIFGE